MHNQGELEGAEVIYREILYADPDNFYALNFCGCICREKRKFDEGIDLLSRAVALQPRNTDAIYNFGNILKDAEQWEEAISCYKKALSFKPENPKALNNLGISLQSVEHYEQAEIALKRAVSLQPDFDIAWFNLGNTFKEQKKYSQAIESYQNAIELKPNFLDAHLKLGHLLIKSGDIEKARQIVTTIRNLQHPEKKAVITIQDHSLVFDWHHRRVQSLLWDVEIAAALVGRKPASHISAVRQANALCFPTVFLGNEASHDKGGLLYEKGYLVDEALIAPDLCTQLINQLDSKALINSKLIELVADNNIMHSVLERIFLHTGFPHLIWNCIYIAKFPDDKSASDMWHYDNHYNAWTPKLMIYLNSQSDARGATHFVSADISRQISEESDYMGLVFQREFYADKVKALTNTIDIDLATLDPIHYIFSPNLSGSGIWFCPAKYSAEIGSRSLPVKSRGFPVL